LSVGRSHGAITVINAMPCGIGATIGVDLWTEATFEVEGDSHMITIAHDPSEDTTMASICVRRAYEHIGIPEPGGRNRRFRFPGDSRAPAPPALRSSGR
jgi:shikimate kinase